MDGCFGANSLDGHSSWFATHIHKMALPKAGTRSLHLSLLVYGWLAHTGRYSGSCTHKKSLLVARSNSTINLTGWHHLAASFPWFVRRFPLSLGQEHEWRAILFLSRAVHPYLARAEQSTTKIWGRELLLAFFFSDATQSLLLETNGRHVWDWMSQNKRWHSLWTKECFSFRDTQMLQNCS